MKANPLLALAQGVVMDNKKVEAPMDEGEVKGFNEAELEDIMNEIESLEKEFVEDAPVQAAPKEDTQVSEEKVVPMRPAPAVAAPVRVSAPVSGASTALDLSVAGTMGVELRFKVGDQTIQLKVTEDEGLVIELAGGARFCVPLHGAKKAS